MLWRGQVIGWANVAVRDEQLQLRAGYVSGRAPRDAAFRPALQEERARLEWFLGVIRYGHVPLVSTFNGAEDCLYYGEIINAGAQWYVDDRKRNNDRRLRTTQNMPRALAEKVVCITAIGSRPQLEEVAEDINSRHIDAVEMHLFENRYSPGWYWLTVHDKRASKEQAVRTLMGMEGLSDRPLVVFGDEVNDRKLFDIASESVAVANAGPHIRSRAKHVIGSNEEDSVVRFIRTHWNGISGVGANQYLHGDGLGGASPRPVEPQS
jgi:hypothetical protein